jgi:hypothetical protein
MVSDGPFAEAKETVGSYALVEVADEAEAIARRPSCLSTTTTSRT